MASIVGICIWLYSAGRQPQTNVECDFIFIVLLYLFFFVFLVPRPDIVCK